jgi:5-hydroxyisourate hydrolase
MRSISTHVLDVSRGRPAQDVPVTLEKKEGPSFTALDSARTDADGRVKELVPEGKLTAGTYRITFDTGAYFTSQGVEGFYPEASIVFVVRDAEAHYHVPLLLSAFGYSTYRGS